MFHLLQKLARICIALALLGGFASVPPAYADDAEQLKALIDQAKAEPRKLSIAHGGNGT